MTWPLVTTPTTIDTDFLAGSQSITIQAAPERTSQAVVDAYSGYINTVQGALNTKPPTDSAAQQLVAAMDGLRSLALNGLQGPPLLPGGPPVTYSVTLEMAQQIDMLSRTLRAAGIFEDDASTITATSLGTWQDLATQGLNAVLQNAQFAINDNNSFQAMIELQYVQTGNDVLSQQLTTLDNALKATQQATDLLGQLQAIHNDIAPASVNTNAVLAFSNPAQLVINNQQAIFNVLSPQLQTAFGVTKPADITQSLYTGSNNPVSFNGLGIIDNIMWRLSDPLWGTNGLNINDPTTQQEMVKAGLIPVDSFGNIYRDSSGNPIVNPAVSVVGSFFGNGTIGVAAGGAAPSLTSVTQQQQAMFDLLTPDQRNAIAVDLDNKGFKLAAGNSPPKLSAADITFQTIKSFLDSSFDNNGPPTITYQTTTGTDPIGFTLSGITGIYDDSKAQQWGIKYALAEQNLLSPPGSSTYISTTQLYNAGITIQNPVTLNSLDTVPSAPDFNLASVRLQVAETMSPAQQTLWGVQIIKDGSGNPIDASIANGTSAGESVLGVFVANVFLSTSDKLAYFKNPNFTWSAMWNDSALKSYAIIFPGLPADEKTAANGILASLSTQQLATLGITTPADPTLTVQPANSNTSQYNTVAQNLYGNPISSVVSFSGQDENTVYAQFESIRSQLAALVTTLNQLSPGTSSDPNSLAGNIQQILTDIQNNVGVPNSAGALKGFENWILDNGQNTGSNTQGNNSGSIQTNIQNGIIGASNLNDKQKQDFNNDLFVFQQFYQSASAMLTTLTQIIEKMAQNAGR